MEENEKGTPNYVQKGIEAEDKSIQLVEAETIEHEEDLMNFVVDEETMNKAKEKVLAAVGPVDEVEKLVTMWSEQKVETIKDLASYNFVVDQEKKASKLLNGIEKKRKEITAPHFAFNRDVNAFAKGIVDKITKGRIHLQKQIENFKDAEKAEAERVFVERCKKLTEAGFQLIADKYVSGMVFLDIDKIKGTEKIPAFSDEEIEFYIKMGEQEKERKAAEAKRIEDQANLIKELTEKLESTKKELAEERIKNAEEKKELAAQGEALETVYEAVTATETEGVTIQGTSEERPDNSESGTQIKTEKSPEPAKELGEVTVTGTTSGPIVSEQGLPAGNVTDPAAPLLPAFDPESVQHGFDIFRQKFIDLMKDASVQYKRVELIDWAYNLTVHEGDTETPEH